MTAKFDTLLKLLGMGRWNLITIVLVGLVAAQIPLSTLGGAFLTPVMDYNCQIPPDGYPLVEDDGDIDENVTKIDACWYLRNSSEGMKKEPCEEWEFDNETFVTTLTSEFQLVCEREYLRPTFQSIYFFGALVSAPVVGFLSDSYGRKTVLSVGVVVYALVLNCLAWLPNLSSILAARFILGLMHPPCISVSYTIAMEEAESKYRAAVGIISFLPWILGYFTWSGQAYLIREWRWLMTSAPMPSLLTIIIMWFVDESPRWLILKGRHDKALRVLQRAARLNRCTLPSDEELLTLMREIQAETEKALEPRQITSSKCLQIVTSLKEESLALVRTRMMRRITLLIYTAFLVSGMVYYGVSLSGATLGSDPFVYMGLSAVMEIPGSTLTLPLVNKLGRRRTNIICYLLTGVSLLLLTVIPKGVFATSMAHMGKMTISAAYQIIYLHATELFPTEVRLRGLGTSSMVSKLGSIIAPYVVDGLGSLYWWAPSVVCGGAALAACFVCFMLPETLGKALHDSVATLEETTKKRSSNYSSDKMEVEISDANPEERKAFPV